MSPHAAAYAGVLRQPAELASDQRRVARSLRALAYTAQAPVLPSDALEIAALLQEIEGRYCDVSDRLHAMARQLVGPGVPDKASST